MEKASRIPELFGCMVFGDREMKARLPEEIYTTLRHTIRRGTPLNIDIANPVAEAMKNWAMELGATHFTHWFQPLLHGQRLLRVRLIPLEIEGNVIHDFASFVVFVQRTFSLYHFLAGYASPF